MQSPQQYFMHSALAPSTLFPQAGIFHGTWTWPQPAHPSDLSVSSLHSTGFAGRVGGSSQLWMWVHGVWTLLLILSQLTCSLCHLFCSNSFRSSLSSWTNTFCKYQFSKFPLILLDKCNFVKHRVLWDVFDEEKFFDSSLTLSARWLFHSAIFRTHFCYLKGDESC